MVQNLTDMVQWHGQLVQYENNNLIAALEKSNRDLANIVQVQRESLDFEKMVAEKLFGAKF